MTTPLVIKLEAAEAAATVTTECVLDITGLGDVTGVEIVNLSHNTGQRVPGSQGLATLGSGEHVRWSYDEEADTLYVAIREDRSLDQRCVLCTVEGTKEGRLMSVMVELDAK